jgi:hypothetical protein
MVVLVAIGNLHVKNAPENVCLRVNQIKLCDCDDDIKNVLSHVRESSFCHERQVHN